MAGFFLASEEPRAPLTTSQVQGKVADAEPSRGPLGHQGGAGLGKKWGFLAQGDQEVQGGREEAVRPSSFHSGSHSPHQLMWPPPMACEPSPKEPPISLNVLSALLFLLGFTDEPPSPSTPVSGKRLHFPWQRCSLLNSFRPGQSHKPP